MKDASAALREALSKLRREQAARAAAAPALESGGGHSPVERWLSGREIECGAGRCYLHQRLHSSVEPAAEKRAQFREVAARLAALEAEGAHRDLVAAARLTLDRSVVLDLETTGFASTPVFLAGCLLPQEDDFLVMQYFARDYSEERALVAAVAERLADAQVLITYNGKSYDLPLLRDRAALHGLRVPEPALHLDLLHHARRRYRGRLPDCRLITLEASRLGRHRFQDVHGSEIPRLYHDFVRSGDFTPLLPVFHHNIFDLLTLSSLVGDLLLSEST